ncbi:hypothetical protein D8674_026351 [Pyrus ussuriensis x Pyrus communis]|uniref:Uncharacterized protein n=1 Tax=Pyrus ussuriensis x Pyrus communis TaxID=2448454 RepID=A0A5N5I9A0_9ROSA|nr:hypothetical protein D8674_026351 [Pyrus ussuriensis x Pyrus communis]
MSNTRVTIDHSNDDDFAFKGVSLVITIGLEILSAGFEQASSPSKPHFVPLGLLFAIVAVLISLSELLRKGRKERVKWRRWGMLGWFCHPSPRNELFGTLLDIYGLLGGIWQCIFSTVQYICYSRHVDNPINLCLLPFIFLICLAVAKLNSELSCLLNR